jgi:FkbM family methyltransferase
MIVESFIQFMKPYKVMGSDEDEYFKFLPGHDLSALHTFLHRNRNNICLTNVADVGANIGLSTLCILDQNPDATVFAFEPAPQNVSLFQQNISINDLSSRVTLEEAAVGDRLGQVWFDFEPTYGAGSKISSGEHGSYQVKLLTLDDFFHEASVKLDFIKIDIEGYEILALAGARHVIQRDRPIVFFECNPHAIRTSGATLIEFLASAIEILGPVGRVEPASGEIFALPADAREAELAILKHSVTNFEVFDLVTLNDNLEIIPFSHQPSEADAPEPG